MKTITLHFKNEIPNDWCNVILVLQTLGKKAGMHGPGLHHREINSQTIIHVHNYIASDIGLPRKQKITVNKVWVQESEIGEECRQFWTWIFGVAWSPGKTRPKHSLSKFAIKIRWEFRRQIS